MKRPSSSYLIDTHVWIWSQIEPERLGPRTQSLLLDHANEIVVSTISTLEVARLAWGERIALDMPISEWTEHALRLLDAKSLEMCHRVAAESYTLPDPFHRDPADRVLVATARIHALTLLTADQRILDYPHVVTLDARL